MVDPSAQLPSPTVPTPPTPPDSGASRADTPDPGAAAGDGSATAKRKKKKPKKKAGTGAGGAAEGGDKQGDRAKKPAAPVLCISRAKHMKYISSYHGPWLQLPYELLESLLALNCDPTTLAPEAIRQATSDAKHALPSELAHPRRGADALLQPLSKTAGAAQHLQVSKTDISNHKSPPAPTPPPPPPIDPGVFRNVIAIRKLVDEASDLAVRAASGLSAAALGALGSGAGGGGAWATANALGIGPDGMMGGGQGNGRGTQMSATRTHRLRVLAVTKLANAYKLDEIAASVMVMQGASALDDLAIRVLKQEPNNLDAQYVQFFHEKIPSRMLAESTTTEVLDSLIAAQPQHLEYYRTRGIVRCFKDEYPAAIRDFTFALNQAKAERKAKQAHDEQRREAASHGPRKKGGKVGAGKKQRSLPAATAANLDAVPTSANDYLDPIEPQLLFLRGAAYIQHAVYQIEEAIIKLEGIRRLREGEGAELRLCYLDDGRYGGTEAGNPAGPLGARGRPKLQAYRAALAGPSFREHIFTLLRKCIRDHERFLSHFNVWDATGSELEERLNARSETAHALRELRARQAKAGVEGSLLYTTYHPLLVESHYSILLCSLMLGDFATLLPAHHKVLRLVDSYDGYPAFLPARSMAQAEYTEVLERLVGGWDFGLPPSRAPGKPLAIDSAAYIPPPPLLTPPPTPSGTGPSTGRNGKSPAGPLQSTPEECLDALRTLLGLAQRKMREREQAKQAREAEKRAQGQAGNGLSSINIPLHGPRVEVVLAWLAAVHLVEVEEAAER